MEGGGAGQAVKMVSATEPGQKTHFLLQAEYNQISIVIGLKLIYQYHLEGTMMTDYLFTTTTIISLQWQYYQL